MLPPVTLHARRHPTACWPPPVFIFSSIRSGSTLLRVLLDSHSEFHAPHEIHLRGLRVKESSKYVEASLRKLGLGREDIEYLLWDRLLHWELSRNNKGTLVLKTPGNAFIWRRITQCWSDARCIFLPRHPAAIARSWHDVQPSWTLDDAAADARRYMDAVEEARQRLSGLTVHYEGLTSEPTATTQQICEYLNVSWESGMLQYGSQQHGSYKPGLGDWTTNIRTGEVQTPRKLPSPEEIPEGIQDLCVSWGYLEKTATVKGPT